MSTLAYLLDPAFQQDRDYLFDCLALFAEHVQRLAYHDLATHVALVLHCIQLKAHVSFRLLGMSSLAFGDAGEALRNFKLARSETPRGEALHGDLEELTDLADGLVEELMAQEDILEKVKLLRGEMARLTLDEKPEPEAEPEATEPGPEAGPEGEAEAGADDLPPLGGMEEEGEGGGHAQAVNAALTVAQVNELWAEAEQHQPEQEEGREVSRPSDAAYEERLRCYRELYAPTAGSPSKRCTACGQDFSLTAFGKDRVVKGVQQFRNICTACCWRNQKVNVMLQSARARHLARGYAGVATITMKWLEDLLARPDLECEISGLRGTVRATCLPWMWSIDEIVPGRGYHPENCRLVVMEMNVPGAGNGERLSRKWVVAACTSVLLRLNGDTVPPTQQEFDGWYLQDGNKAEVRRLITKQRKDWLGSDGKKDRPTMTLEDAIAKFEEQRGECSRCYMPLPLEGIGRFSGDRTVNHDRTANHLVGHVFDNTSYVLGFLNCQAVSISEEEGGGVGEGMSERKMAQLVLGQRGKPEFPEELWTPRVLLELERRAALPAPGVNAGGGDDDGDDDDYSGFGEGQVATLECVVCHRSFFIRGIYAPDAGGVFMCEECGACVGCSGEDCGNWRYVTKEVDSNNDELFCSEDCGGAIDCGAGGWSNATAEKK